MGRRFMSQSTRGMFTEVGVIKRARYIYVYY